MTILSVVLSGMALIFTIYITYYFHFLDIEEIKANIKIIIAQNHSGVIPVDILISFSEIADERNVLIQTKEIWDKLQDPNFEPTIDNMKYFYFNLTDKAYKNFGDRKVPWDKDVTVKHFFRELNKEETEKAFNEFLQYYNNGNIKTQDDLKNFIEGKSNLLNEKFMKFLRDKKYLNN